MNLAEPEEKLTSALLLNQSDLGNLINHMKSTRTEANIDANFESTICKKTWFDGVRFKPPILD